LAGEFCRRIYRNLPTPAEGWLVLPETPGLGFEPDHDAVKEVAHAL
jgi:L-alanine-DL-glutamate epimerase-like enolase superfamily enzyme